MRYQHNSESLKSNPSLHIYKLKQIRKEQGTLSKRRTQLNNISLEEWVQTIHFYLLLYQLETHLKHKTIIEEYKQCE